MASDELALRRRCLADFRALVARYPALRHQGAEQRLHDYVCHHTETQGDRMPTKDYRMLGEELTNVAVRVPLSVLREVDHHIPTLRTLTPWARVGRSEALRDLILKGLQSLHTTATPVATDAAPPHPSASALVEQTPPRSTPAAPPTRPRRQGHQDAPPLLPTSASGPSYDSTKYVLGKLCPRQHDYHGSGQSLLRLPKRNCLHCAHEKHREKRATRSS